MHTRAKQSELMPERYVSDAGTVKRAANLRGKGGRACYPPAIGPHMQVRRMNRGG
jgi:hypothetical protein